MEEIITTVSPAMVDEVVILPYNVAVSFDTAALFFFDFMRVSGTSMEPAIHDKGHVIINKITYGLVRPFGEDLLLQWNTPKVGDIVAYFHNNKLVIKRCVGCQGDSIDFYTDLGYSLSVNGRKIPLTETQYQRLKHNKTVPEDMILAVGDNYEVSVDSRDYGFIFVDNIIGRVVAK